MFGTISKLLNRSFKFKLYKKGLHIYYNLWFHNDVIPLKEKIRITFVEAIFQLGYPITPSLYLSPSHQCNIECVHCFEVFNETRDKNKLETEEVKKIIKDFRNLNGIRITFCSGEFLMQPNSLELIEYAAKNGILVSVTSNGTLLNKSKIRKLKEAGLANLSLSIDSPDPKQHEYIRQTKGIHEHILKVMPLMDEHKLNYNIWTFISRSNFSDILEWEKFAERNNVNQVFIYFPLLSGHFYDDPAENLTREEREYCRKLCRTTKRVTLELYAEKDLCGGGGKEHFNIMPTGDVTFCPPVAYSYGNVKTGNMSEIFDKIRKDRKRFDFKGQCPTNFQDYRDNCDAKLVDYAQSKSGAFPKPKSKPREEAFALRP